MGPDLIPAKCSGCKDGTAELFPFSMAFQPIVDLKTNSIFAYEALARGCASDDSACNVMEQINSTNRYIFDQSCRVKALRLAAQLKLAESGAMLAINFMPGAVYAPASCIQLTLKTAEEVGFPTNRIIFEITEAEEVGNRTHLRSIVEDYRQRGFRVALDDFGAGYSGLNLLADLPVDIVKLDMDLTRNLQVRPKARFVVDMIVKLAETLGCDVIAEGVETEGECRVLRECGIRYLQGHLFSRPMFEALPKAFFPEV